MANRICLSLRELVEIDVFLANFNLPVPYIYSSVVFFHEESLVNLNAGRVRVFSEMVIFYSIRHTETN